MPHEHINSSIGTVDEHGAERITRERVVLTWNKPSAATAYDAPDGGYVQIMSEWPESEARFPSPQMIEIDPTAPHAFHVAEDSNECRWCGQTEPAGPHGITNPDLPHRYRADVSRHANGIATCVHCNRVAGHVIHTDAAPEPFNGPRVATHIDHSTCDHPATVAGRAACRRSIEADDPRAPYALGGEAWASGSARPPHRFKAVATSDPDSDQDICEHCRMTRRDGNHAGHKQRVLTEGEPTWSEPCTGLAVTFTRADINRLIKMLRRARDEAYGADA
jgi:hypothetical protein